jgi:ATP-dependent helicase/nuclease subunit B
VRTPDGAPGDLRAWRDPRGQRRLAAEPVRPTTPTVPADALPQRLSASAFEALRACPYRFFAERVLRLSELDELDDEVEKRDYGTWLHDVLDVFHRERGEPRDAATDETRLREIGETVRAAMGLDAAAFLPYDASFAGFVPRYVKWLHDRERLGWRWQSGESEASRAPPELEGLEIYGRIDRIDRREGKDGPTLELIDYKTGSVEKLKETLREPLEDTQLAFYAALVGDDLPVAASYLAVDRTRGLIPVVHPRVADDARALVVGIADEMRRLRAGAGLRALGEGSACDYCQARGLCRRDHWASDDDAP